VAASSKWRTSEDAQRTSGLIGPNAILQLLPVMTEVMGPERTARLLRDAEISRAPDGLSMIPETEAARLHRSLRREQPDLAPRMSTEAGTRTADYILAHRIPKPVQWVLRLLPAGPAARMLAGAIDRHAWTFAGSGQFRIVTPWTFEIADNPLIRGEHSDRCICHWHAAVFTRLYTALVSQSCRCRETECASQGRGNVCRFELYHA
jgi:divinyl protochlorophyllide a 8-vinyl-reductase